MGKKKIDDDGRTKKLNLLKQIKAFFATDKNKNQKISDTIAEIVSNSDTKIDDFGAEEKEIVINAVNFTDTKVEDVMVPRTDIIAAKIDASFNDIKEIVNKRGHTRIPIYVDSLDNIKGYIHIKDLLPFFDNSKKLKIESIIQKVIFIPASMKVVDLILKMKESKTRLAIVIDEYGGTDGMLTIEDLMEEIVGDFEDNEDIKVEDNAYEVNARIKSKI